MEVIRVPELPVHRPAIQKVFDRLSDRQKLYSHHLTRAAWQGSRIIMRQVSPEAIGIFDFIMNIRKSCGGKWQALVDDGSVMSPPRISRSSWNTLVTFSTTWATIGWVAK